MTNNHLVGSLGSPVNRADRRRQAKCRHDWKVKEHGDGVGHRWCESCGREEWHDSATRFTTGTPTDNQPMRSV